MKKLFAIILAVACICACFVGCADKKTDPKPSVNVETQEPTKENPEKETKEIETDLPETEPVESEKPSEEVTEDPSEVVPTEGENPTEEPEKPQGLSDDWWSGKFVIDDVIYQIGDEYQKLADNGWTFETSDYQNMTDDYVLNSKNYIATLITLNNEKYVDDYKSAVVGYSPANLQDEVQTIKNCEIRAIELSAIYGFDMLEDHYTFSIGSGIEEGMTKDQIVEILGEPDDVYEAEADEYHKGYVVYTYEKDLDNHVRAVMKLTIYNEFGMQKVNLSWYY